MWCLFEMVNFITVQFTSCLYLHLRLSLDLKPYGIVCMTASEEP